MGRNVDAKGTFLKMKLKITLILNPSKNQDNLIENDQINNVGDKSQEKKYIAVPPNVVAPEINLDN